MRLDQFPLPKKPGYYWALGHKVHPALELCGEDERVVASMFYSPEEHEWHPYFGNDGGKLPPLDLMDAVEYVVHVVDHQDGHSDPSEIECSCFLCGKRKHENQFGVMDHNELKKMAVCFRNKPERERAARMGETPQDVILSLEYSLLAKSLYLLFFFSYHLNDRKSFLKLSD